MRIPTSGHLRTHPRFYGAALVGFAVWVLTLPFHQPFRLSLAGSAAFAVYLASTWLFALELSPDELRERAAEDDEGIGLIILIALGAITLSLYSLIRLIKEDQPDTWHLWVAISTVPLGWFTLHTIMAFHYAHLYYAPPDDPKVTAREAGGLDFPGDEPPHVLDFIYYSLVVGMTSQVSDVAAVSKRMRNATLLHGVVSFFFNTGIVALAVNAVGGR